MSQTSLYTIAQRNDSDGYLGLTEDFTQYSPEFYQIPAVARAGTTFKSLIRTSLPTAQFRLANQALTCQSSTYKQTIHEMFYLDIPIVVDEMVYKADDGVTGDLLYQEAQGGLQSAINYIGNQTWYGTVNDANGFYGIRQQLLPTGSAITPVSASNSNSSSTAYGLWLNPQGVAFNVGKYGEFSFPSFVRQFVTTGASNAGSTAAGYWAYVTNIASFIGLSVVSTYSVFGVTGCQGTGGATLTDKLAQVLVATVPLTRRAGFSWFMNRTVHGGLQSSRTSINYQPAGAANGTPAWSPPPLMLEGYPIILTDAITNTENNT